MAEKGSDMDSTRDTTELVRLKVHGVVPDQNTETHIVILRDEHNAEILPIWVGSAEGNAIRLALEGILPPRPMTHDLLRSLADHLGIKVTRVVVTDVRNNTYYAAIHLLYREAERAIDSRPSDAFFF